MQLGFIGLGKMGSRMVTKLVKEGHEIVAWNRSSEKTVELAKELEGSKGKLIVSISIADVCKKLDKPRAVWSMLPPGDITEDSLSEIAKNSDKGDIIIDGANSHFSDTQKRYEKYSKYGFRYLGIGVSGGVIAVTEGYPQMAGGDKDAYDQIRPILDTLAKPGGGHEYFGEGGAGHFVKMIHNGIEYGYMQAIGEGFGIMDKSQYDFDLQKVARLYTKGTLVSGFMMDRTVESLDNDPDLSKLEGEIDATGEGEWTINEAKKLEVPVNVIEESLEFRKQSKLDKKISASFAARMVAALRFAFGGHAIKNK